MQKTIVACTNTGRQTKEGKTIFEVEIDNGQKCTSFGDDFTPFLLDTIEVDLKEGKEYNGVKQWYIYLPKAKGKFPQKDWSYDKKKTAITVAGNLAAFNKQTVEQAIDGANKILKWLKEE